MSVKYTQSVAKNMDELTDIQILQEKVKFLEKQTEIILSRIENIESSAPLGIENQMALYLSVPDSIRKTLFVVSKEGECTADDVSKKTGRHRSIENKYLNELTRAGWLDKYREGKMINYVFKKQNQINSSIPEQTIELFDNKIGELLE
jgi:predicted transcriptional regulator